MNYVINVQIQASLSLLGLRSFYSIGDGPGWFGVLEIDSINPVGLKVLGSLV